MCLKASKMQSSTVKKEIPSSTVKNEVQSSTLKKELCKKCGKSSIVFPIVEGLCPPCKTILSKIK